MSGEGFHSQGRGLRMKPGNVLHGEGEVFCRFRVSNVLACALWD